MAITISNHFYSDLIRQDRLKWIDNEIISDANKIIDSALLYTELEDFRYTDELLENIFEGYLLGLIIIIRDGDGHILYRNRNAIALNMDPSFKERWQLFSIRGNDIRLLNIIDPTATRILQFGSLINRSALSYDILTVFNNRLAIVSVVMALVISYLLTVVILSPLTKLKDHIEYLTDNFESSINSSSSYSPSFMKVMSKRKGPFGGVDELNQLVVALELFLKNFRNAVAAGKTYSARLAHEINTPLTIIKNRVSTLKNANPQLTPDLEEINLEIDSLAEFSRNYTEWVQNTHISNFRPEIYAINLDQLMNKIVNKLSNISMDRLKAEIKTDKTIFADPKDIEHLVINLVTNALKYSEENKMVYLQVKDYQFSLEDKGSGIPPTVMEKLGEPFNVGKSDKKGHGLGLAWVVMIANKYRWALKISNDQKTQKGTRIDLDLSPQDSLKKNS